MVRQGADGEAPHEKVHPIPRDVEAENEDGSARGLPWAKKPTPPLPLAAQISQHRVETVCIPLADTTHVWLLVCINKITKCFN